MRMLPAALRIALTAAAIGGLVLLVCFLGYRFVAQPQITVTAPNGSIVRLIDMRTGLQVSQTTVDGSPVTLYAGVGNYKVAVANKDDGQAFYTRTALLKRVSLRFAPPRQLTPTLVAHQVAYDPLEDAGRLDYLNTSAQAIEQLSGNTVTALDSFGSTAPRNDGTSAQVMKVIAGNRAIVLTHYNLYVLQKGHLDALRTDGFPDTINSVVIGTNPGQESFAVLVNGTLYWYRSPSAQPQIVATLTKRADQLAVGGNQAIAYSTRMPDAKQDIRYAYSPTYAVDPILISLTSGSQRTLGQGPITDASISPDGQYATLEQRGGSHTDIVRLADNVTLQAVDNADTLTPIWISSTRYAYGKDSSVYVFDINTQSASIIATLPRDQLITSITYNADEQRYIVSTYPSEQGAAIYQLQ